MLQQFYSSYISIKGSEDILKDTLQLLNQPNIPIESNIRMENNDLQRIVSLENVSFKYKLELPYVLKNINLDINSGDIIGIYGKTGSGKSTLLDIIVGLLNPSKGNLWINNKIISDFEKIAWQYQIIYVPQSIYISDNTVAENIAFGIAKQDIDMKLVRQASKRAKISSVINNLEKYETTLGERGVRLLWRTISKNSYSKSFL